MKMGSNFGPAAILVPRTTGTYADVLSAIGKATLLAELSGPGAQVVIGNTGAEYAVWVSSGDASRAALTVGYSYLAVEKAPAAPKAIAPSPFPYADERAKEDVWRKWQATRRKTRQRGATGALLVERQPPAPDARLELFKAIHSLQGSKSWNALALWLHQHLRAKPFVGYVTSRLSGAAGEYPAKRPSIGVVQAFSPAAGKGTNRGKPDGAPLDNLKGLWLDWFEEWCKYRAVAYCLNAQFFGQDIKFTALLPGERIDLNALRGLADALVDRKWVAEGLAYSAVKHDALGLLWLADWLVRHSEFAPQKEDIRYRFLHGQATPKLRARDLLAGISTATFASLGQARALANTADLLLPDWFPISRETHRLWLGALEEHRSALRLLHEDMAEEANLLLSYRQALSTNSLFEYLAFFASYGENVMRRRGRGDYREQFTVARTEDLIMALAPDSNPAVQDLVRKDEFRRLAYAVHQATVQAQYWQEQKPPPPNLYDVHYGLAQRWKRAVDRHEFVNELMEFARVYNEENSKKNERRRKQGQYCRENLAQSDLDAVLGYLDSRLSAATISLLLLAYGYAMTDEEKKRLDAARAAGVKRRSAEQAANKTS